MNARHRLPALPRKRSLGNRTPIPPLQDPGRASRARAEARADRGAIAGGSVVHGAAAKESLMVRRKTSTEFIAFDVLYEDGSRSSNRKVASSELAGPNSDAAVCAIIEAQDRQLAALSGRPRGAIKSIARSASHK
jgi:hypothetical protein